MKVFFVLFIFYVTASCESNNVCCNYPDYYFIDFSSNCFHDKYLFSNQLRYLKAVFPNYETHEVTTEDGYILTMYRLPRKNPKGVIILQHPSTTDSIIYYVQGNESAAILFYNAGYEVWLPNNRGTPSSQRHISMNVTEYKYWDFGFHEIGIYDYSAIITYIAKKTKRNDITFVGHSLSTTASIIYAAMKPDEAVKYIKIFVEMSPATYSYNLKSPIKIFCKLINVIEVLSNFFKLGSSLGKDSIIKNIIRLGAYRWNPFKILYIILINIVVGWAPDPVDPLLINRLLSDVLQDVSLKSFIHYGQICENGGTFRMYDYRKKNKEIYNTSIPPEYPIENIKVPIYLIAGEKDTTTTVEDSKYLFSRLPQEATVYGNYIASKLNHVSFHTSIYRFSVYQHIIDLLSILY